MDSFVGGAIFAAIGGFVGQVDRQKSSVLSWSSEVDLCKALASKLCGKNTFMRIFFCVSETYMHYYQFYILYLYKHKQLYKQFQAVNKLLQADATKIITHGALVPRCKSSRDLRIKLNP